MFAEYVKTDSFIHRLSSITKIFLIIMVWIAALLVYHPILLALLVLLDLSLWILARIPYVLQRIKHIFSVLAIVFAIWILVQGFMFMGGKGTPLFAILGHPFTLEGLIFGVTLCIKVLAIVCITPILLWTTPLSKFIAGLYRLGLPYRLVFMLGMALRFISLISTTYEEILNAQRLRCHDIERLNYLDKLRKGYIPLVAPLVLCLMRRSSDLEIAIESRAFGAPVKRTFVEEVSLGKGDYVILGVFITITAILIWAAFVMGYITPLGLFSGFK
ncbi:MAG: hypothetical protein DRJ69_00850 [Thermoprotei archaeon]|nr:MAG: hypothetical protein DRJ59_03570 [Thermoprotei archaeon]RLF12613.1 MAG: hypothetical protein DRJ69_00850 [Thermoprotei archaeon]